MKKISYSLTFKVTAFILSAITVAITVFGSIGMLILIDSSFYTKSKDSIKKDVFKDISSGDLATLIHRFSVEEMEYSEIIDEYEETNLIFEIADSPNTIVLKNYGNEEYFAKNTENFVIETYDRNKETYILKNYNATVYLKKDFTTNDKYSFAFSIVDIAYSLRYLGYVIVFAALILSVFLWIYMILSAGHSCNNENISLNHLDRVPFDLMIGIEALIITVCLYFAFDYHDPETNILFMFISGIVGYILILITTLTASTRIKCGVFLKNNIITRVFGIFKMCIIKIKDLLKYIFNNINVVWKVALVSIGIALLGFFIILIFLYSPSNLLWIWIVANLITIPILLLVSIIFVRLKNGGERIANGDVNANIDTKYLFGDFKDFGIILNNIGAGLQNAVNEQMKSERMKTELITNVSHDIKTPLTSIINYVDLLKKEETDNPEINEYIEVLDRQSKRLKKLIDDLIEASKASSGVLKIDAKPCDISVLLSQAVAEYEDKFQKSSLVPILNIPNNIPSIIADGKYLWRIFDNLFNNICKYSMPDTRIYLDVIEKDENVVITFKNVSHYPLNITSDELMERFVRGDTSRNTEGSGLGLSITKSLVELQNGTFSISIDGDLFKTQIVFKKAKI